MVLNSKLAEDVLRNVKYNRFTAPFSLCYRPGETDQDAVIQIFYSILLVTLCW